MQCRKQLLTLFVCIVKGHIRVTGNPLLNLFVGSATYQLKSPFWLGRVGGVEDLLQWRQGVPLSSSQRFRLGLSGLRDQSHLEIGRVRVLATSPAVPGQRVGRRSPAVSRYLGPLSPWSAAVQHCGVPLPPETTSLYVLFSAARILQTSMTGGAKVRPRVTIEGGWRPGKILFSDWNDGRHFDIAVEVATNVPFFFFSRRFVPWTH